MLIASFYFSISSVTNGCKVLVCKLGREENVPKLIINIYYNNYCMVCIQIHFRMTGYTDTGHTGKFYIKVATHVNCVDSFQYSQGEKKNKRPGGLTTSAATLTLGPEIGSLGHIVKMHLKVPPISM